MELLFSFPVDLSVSTLQTFTPPAPAGADKSVVSHLGFRNPTGAALTATSLYIDQLDVGGILQEQLLLAGSSSIINSLSGNPGVNCVMLANGGYAGFAFSLQDQGTYIMRAQVSGPMATSAVIWVDVLGYRL